MLLYCKFLVGAILVDILINVMLKSYCRVKIVCFRKNKLFIYFYKYSIIVKKEQIILKDIEHGFGVFQFSFRLSSYSKL
jgi:hypothetical protein